MGRYVFFTYFLLIISILCLGFNTAKSEALIADHSFVQYWSQIPNSVITEIVDNCEIYYWHTSHGGQIRSGMTEVHDLDNRFHDLNYYPHQIFHHVGDDLGYNGDTTWAGPTRTYLNNNPECNFAMYAWCGGVSYNTENGINIYLNKMSELESQYPNVTFVYMTGHLDGTGPSGNLYTRNNQIRDYCTANSKVLFDFADIESYDPDGNYYPDASDACEWCSAWCADVEHACDDGCYCAHSHCFNCRMKSQVWWVMMALLQGWTITDVGTETITIPEKTQVIQNYPNPFNATTLIKYELTNPSDVSIDIYSVDGRYITTLVDQYQDAGNYSVAWDASDHSAGMYLARLKTSNFAESIKLLLLK